METTWTSGADAEERPDYGTAAIRGAATVLVAAWLVACGADSEPQMYRGLLVDSSLRLGVAANNHHQATFNVLASGATISNCTDLADKDRKFASGVEDVKRAIAGLRRHEAISSAEAARTLTLIEELQDSVEKSPGIEARSACFQAGFSSP